MLSETTTKEERTKHRGTTENLRSGWEYSPCYDPDITQSRNIILQGKSSFQHKFDFLIPASGKAPERIMKAVSTPKKQNIITQLFAFEDTKLERQNEGIVILSDLDKEVAPDVIQAIEEYGINDFSWKEREKWIEQLAA
jgi:hypothetical protein